MSETVTVLCTTPPFPVLQAAAPAVAQGSRVRLNGHLFFFFF